MNEDLLGNSKNLFNKIIAFRIRANIFLSIRFNAFLVSYNWDSS